MPDGDTLIATPQDDTTAVTGIGIAESSVDLANGVSNGDWVEAGLGAVGVGLEALSMVIDPVGTVASYGVGWLIEHVQPLKEALDWFAGDPPVIRSFSETWGNVAAEVGSIAQDYGSQAQADTAGWQGAAADAYRSTAAQTADAVAGAGALADGISAGVMIMGEVVAAVRELVRELVAEVVGRLISWALEVIASLGLATPLVVAQASAAVAKTVNKIADLVRKLVKTIGNVTPRIRKIIDKLDEIIAKLAKLARSGNAPDAPHAPRSPDAPSAPRSPDGPHRAPDTTSPSSTGPSSTHTTPDTTHPSSTGTSPDTTSPSSTSPSSASPSSASPSSTSPSSTSPDTGTTPSTTRSPDGPTAPDGTMSQGGPTTPRDTKSTPDGTRGDNPKADSRERECVPGSGDPVDLLTGQMFMTQIDAELSSVLPLVLQRTHFSAYRNGRLFGRTWASTLDQRLEVSSSRIRFADEQGVRLVYPVPAMDGAPVLPEDGPRWQLSLDEQGYRIHQPQSGRTLHFGHNDVVASIKAVTDRNGTRIDFDHRDGVPIAVRHSGGYHLDIGSTDGLITDVRLRSPDGPITLVRYRYDDARRLTEVVNSSGQAHRFEYDSADRITQWVDRNGEWYRYHYDDHGRVTYTAGSGDALTGIWQYDTATDTAETTTDTAVAATRHTNSLGHMTTYFFNDAGQLVREIDPLGNETQREWDRYNRLLARTDPLGRTTRYDYDHDGNIIAITRPDGSRSRAEYDERGLRTKVVDPGGATWQYEYDATGNLIVTTDPAGARTSYDYDEQGNLRATVDPLGNTTTITTDAAGLPIAVTDPQGAVTRYVRDTFGRVAAIVNPLGGTTRCGWNVEGQPLWRTLPDGSTERWRYDAEGNEFEQVSATGAVTRTETTHFGLPLRRIGPDGSRLEFTYDTELRLTAVANAHSATWRYHYDAAGRLTHETDFNGRTVSYAYDAAGQLVATTNGEGETIRLHRDVLGNVVARDAGGKITRFEFDPVGRMTRAVNSDAELTFELDALGRPLAETVNGRRLVSEFDALGRRTRRVTPSGEESSWSYDAAGRAVALHTAGHTTSFHRDDLGREVQRRIDTGTVLTQDWDPSSRLVAQTVTMVGDMDAATGPAQLVQQRSYRYRPDGNLDAVEDLLSGARSYGLDRAGRVAEVRAAGWTERYAYDLAGNVVEAFGPADGTDGTDTQGPRQYAGTLVHQAGNVRNQYDAQGRVVLRQRKRLSAKPDTWRYVWDAEDRLVGITTPDGSRWRYLYDPLGRRIAKQRVDPTTGAVLAQIWFTWDGVQLAEQVSHGGRATTWNFEPGSFRPLTQTERRLVSGRSQEWVDEQFYSIVTDLVGAPTELVDGAGRVAWHARATLWGQTAGDPDAPGYTPLRFPGQYHDPETGFHYNYRRYYDPTTGRYASGDPLGLAAAPDPHSYATNPTTWADPLGLTSKKCDPSGGDTETFYRGMSRAEYENQVRAQDSLFPLHGETFVTRDIEYIEQLAARHPGKYEVLVRLDMEPGTRDALLAAGGRDDPASRAIRTMGLDNLPILEKGNGQVHIKAELGYLNFGLRKDSVGIFNDRLKGHEIIREF